jgi:hypothetical protein
MVSVLTREIVPAAPFAAKPLSTTALVGPSPNVEGKRDRLPVEAPASEPMTDPVQGEPLRQAYAADSPLIEPTAPLSGPVPMPRARGAGRPAIQKNYTLLSDIQIAAIRGRLKLTPAQEALWPGVEAALRVFAKTMHDKRQAGGLPAIDGESAELEQLKAAAMPLIAQLREDQKREVRSLARIIGLEAVASQI